MGDMTLYYAPGACSFAAHLILHEAGMEFDAIKVDLRAKKTADGKDFRAVNPLGYVPVLDLGDGKTTLTEAPVVLQYLADRAAGNRLAPPNGTLERYRLQQLLAFISTELHKSYGPLFGGSLPEDARAVFIDKIKSRYDFLDRQLKGKEYLAGDAFSIADAYLATILNWSGHVKLDLAQWPNLHALHKRVFDRPAAKAAMEAEKA